MVAQGAAARVALDGQAFGDGSQFRGIGTYLRQIVQGLAARGEIDLVVLAERGVPLPAGAARVEVRRALPSRWRRREHEWRLPAEVRRSGAALLHSPAQLPPRRSPVPWVQTLHDLTPLVFDTPVLAADRRHWQRVGPRLREAAAVICVSRSSADQARRLLAVPAQRLHVVPLGVDPGFRPHGPVEQRATPYLLWVAAWGPHKGLDEALAVLGRLTGAGRPHHLVVAGRQDPWMRAQVDAAVAASGLAARVDVVGHLDGVEALAALYRGADALLVTSRAEGFGLPALEALACGVPVVAFANTSLPEVVGDAGVLAPDGDVGAFTAAVERVLDAPGLRDELALAGPAHAARFTWAATVAAHAEIYRAALGAG